MSGNSQDDIYSLLDRVSDRMYATFEVKYFALVGEPIPPRTHFCGHHSASRHLFDECHVTKSQLAIICSWLPDLIVRSDKQRERQDDFGVEPVVNNLTCSPALWSAGRHQFLRQK